MKLNSVTPRRTLSWVYGSFLLIALVSNSMAASQVAGQKSGFFQQASENIGGFFHRLFNPNETPPPPQQQQRSQSGQRGNPKRPGSTRYNLDTPPTGVTPAMPKGNATESPPKPKINSGTTKTSSSQKLEEPKTTKTKVTNTTQEKKNVVVKNNTPEIKLPPEKKPVRNTTPDTGSSAETKSTGKTEPTTTPKLTQEQSVLTGSKTSKAGRVKSPYPPYNELDVSGLSTGSLALDPTTQKVFRVP